MKEIRCKKCNKLLYKIDHPLYAEVENDVEQIHVKDSAIYQTPIVECKCPRCGEMNTKKESVENERGNK